MTQGLKLRKEEVAFAEGSVERILYDTTTLPKEALQLKHDMFIMEMRNEELYFVVGNEIARELRNCSITKQTVDGISYVDMLFSPNYSNSFGYCESMMHSIMRALKNNEYEPGSSGYQFHLMAWYAMAFFKAQFDAIKTLADVTRPVPLPLFLQVLNKQKDIEVMHVDGKGTRFAGKLQKAEIKQSFFSTNLVGKISMISKGKENYVEGTYSVTLPLTYYVQKLEDIGLIPLTPELKAEFAERGKKYVDYTKNPSYRYYKGFAYRPGGWFGDIRLNVNGRVMIDIGAMRALNSTLNDSWYYGNPFCSNSYDDDDDDDNDSNIGIAITEDNIWTCSPVVYGFSFGTKDWMRMSVEEVSEIDFSETAFDELIIPETYKEIFVHCLTNEMPSLDAIEGKGNAKIFLLSGPPGCGKTLTAESVAEYLKMPIYYVSVGELGTSPEDMEINLAQVMDIATSWSAIVLLDEVDVFAVKRSGSDIKRNAMTAILLRLLERYNGIMFMTTNLIDNLDQAFISRATATIPYKDLESVDRAKIWNNLLGKAGKLGMAIDQEVLNSVDDLAKNDLNGREIKNRIRLAYSVAAGQKDRKITMKILNSVVNIKKVTTGV